MDNFLENERKLAYFKDSIIAEAMNDAHSITEELRQARETAIRIAEEELYLEAKQYSDLKSAEISARHSRAIAAHRNANNHKLLEYREKCANEVLDIVRARVKDFADSDAYPAHMLRLIQKAVAQIPDESFSADVYLRPDDMHLSTSIQNVEPYVKMAFAEGSFALGGLQLVCKSRGIRVDLSFDSALDDMVGHYSELSADLAQPKETE